MELIEDSEYLTLLITDIKLHIIKPRKPNKLSRQIQKSLNNGVPFRAYHSQQPKLGKDHTFTIQLADEKADFVKGVQGVFRITNKQICL